MKTLKTMLLFLTLLTIAIGCSTSGEKASGIFKKEVQGEIVHDAFTVGPSGSHEECIELRPGMVFDYEFDASDFINFNIHYHAVDDIHYPVNKKGVRFGKGTIDPGTHNYYTKEQEYYCLMWDNVNDEPVRISFTCVLRGE